MSRRASVRAPVRVIVSADDFGLSTEVNEAVERAHREGILSTASLMVSGPAAADAVARAHANPELRVGLHLVVVEGAATVPASPLAGTDGWFPGDQLRLGIDYFFRPVRRRQLLAEIEAQFAAFAATGLRLDHANSHKHMHMHPTVGAMLLRVGQAHGLPAVRAPTEPGRVLARCGARVGLGAGLLRRWSGLFRARARRAGMRVNDHVFGLAWSGEMTAERLIGLAPALPPGLSEIYLHPATGRNMLLRRLMPGYRHEAELAALVSPAVWAALDAAGVERATWDAA